MDFVSIYYLNITPTILGVQFNSK